MERTHYPGSCAGLEDDDDGWGYLPGQVEPRPTRGARIRMRLRRCPEGTERARRRFPAARCQNSRQSARVASGLETGQPNPRHQAAIVARMNRGSAIANRPGAMVPPQLYSAGFVSGKLAGHVAGGRGHMGWADAAWAVSHFGPLRRNPILSASAGPGAGSQKANKDRTNLSASAEGNFGRLIVHDRKLPMASAATLAWVSEDFQYSAESCFTNARRGGVQIRHHLGKEPRFLGPQANSQSPITELFSVASHAIR